MKSKVRKNALYKGHEVFLSTHDNEYYACAGAQNQTRSMAARVAPSARPTSQHPPRKPSTTTHSPTIPVPLDNLSATRNVTRRLPVQALVRSMYACGIHCARNTNSKLQGHVNDSSSWKGWGSRHGVRCVLARHGDVKRSCFHDTARKNIHFHGHHAS